MSDRPPGWRCPKCNLPDRQHIICVGRPIIAPGADPHEQRARSHECPKCGACPDQPCWTIRPPLSIREQAHLDRYRAAGLAPPPPAEVILQSNTKTARVVHIAEWWDRKRRQKERA